MKPKLKFNVFTIWAAAFILTGCTSTSTTTSGLSGNDHLYATGNGIRVYDLPLTSASTPAVTNGSGGVGTPCFDSAGHIFVPSQVLNGNSSNGVVLAFSLSLGPNSTPVFSLPAGADTPLGCRFDSSGNMYVRQANGVQVFKAPVQSGSAVNSTITLPSGASPTGIWTDASGNVYISSNTANFIYSSLASGNVLQAKFGGGGGGIALGPSGSLYVLDGSTNGEIDVYDPPFTNNSKPDASKAIIVESNDVGNYLDSMTFDSTGDMFVYGCGGCIPTGLKQIFVLAPPYQSATVDFKNLDLNFSGFAVGP